MLQVWGGLTRGGGALQALAGAQVVDHRSSRCDCVSSCAAHSWSLPSPLSQAVLDFVAVPSGPLLPHAHSKRAHSSRSHPAPALPLQAMLDFVDVQSHPLLPHWNYSKLTRASHSHLTPTLPLVDV